MKIEIDLNDLGFTYDPDGNVQEGRTIRDAVVSAAAAQILATSGWNYQSDLNSKVREVANKEIQARMTEALRGAIQRTTVWGEAIGEPTTLLEIVRHELGKFVDGKDIRSNMSINDKPRNLAELIHLEVASLLRGELRDEIRAVRTAVGDGLRDKALKAAAAALVSSK